MVSNDGLLRPRSMSDTKSTEIPANSASFSCVRSLFRRNFRSRFPNLILISLMHSAHHKAVYRVYPSRFTGYTETHYGNSVNTLRILCYNTAPSPTSTHTRRQHMMPQTPTWSEARRKTTATSVLDRIALFCLGASLLFWGVLYFTLIAPPLPQLAPQTFVALALTVMSALIIPLFWSILVPTTPAGQLLQKTQWGTIGFWVILAAALYMTWYANQWIGLWWFNQTVIRENNLVGPVTIFCLIGFILVPSLACTVVTPERWLVQVHQAREVRKT